MTTSDLTEQIKELGALSPAFAFGKPQAKLQRERLDQGKRNMMSMLAESYHDVHIGSRTFNELGHSPMSNQFIISHDRLQEDSQPPSPLTGAEVSELDAPIQPGLPYASALQHHAQASTTAPPREGARSVDPYLGSKNRTTVNLKGGMHMIGEEEEREFIEEDTKSAMSRSRSNPAGSAKELGLQGSPSSALPKNPYALGKRGSSFIPGKHVDPSRLNLLGQTSSISSFARLPHSNDIYKTQKNFGKNAMKTLTLCANEKAQTHLEKEQLEKPEFVLKSTLHDQNDLSHKISQIKHKLSTNKIASGIFIDR